MDSSGNQELVPYIPLSYDSADSHTSALRLVLSVFPEWEGGEGQVEFFRFTDGVTNTVGRHRTHFSPTWPPLYMFTSHHVGLRVSRY